MSKLTQERPLSERAHVGRDTVPQKPDAFQAEQPSHAPAQNAPGLEQVGAHLANERTFLAWVWTGMMLMFVGVTIAKMGIGISDFSQSISSTLQSSVNHKISATTMGMLFLTTGLLTIVMSAYRYLAVQNQLRNQKYVRADNFVLVFLMALVFLGGILITLVLQLS